MQPDHIYLFHGSGGSPDGSVFKLEQRLRPLFPQSTFHRPWVRSPEEVEALKIEQGAVIIGNSLGGLMAAKLQEERSDLSVMTLSSPTRHGSISLGSFKHNIVALYSSLDPVIKGRTNWQNYTNESYDVSWMEDHHLDSHIYSVVYVLSEFLRAPETVGAAIAEVGSPLVLA
jgi:esterase/lipase